MATIHNTSLTKELTDVAKIQTSFDSVPSQLAEKVVPVIDVNPKHARLTNYYAAGNKTTTGNLVVLTAPTDRDLYITTLIAGFIKDAACDSATGYYNIQATIDGTTATDLYEFPHITLTAQTATINIHFQIP